MAQEKRFARIIPAAYARPRAAIKGHRTPRAFAVDAGAARVQTSRAMTELTVEDIQVGSGAEAVTGRTVEVHYTGRLVDGTKFDSSLDRGAPFAFPLGAGRVIQGWDRGVVGMRVGGRRKLTIPASLGYGARGFANLIPPNSTLVFDIELLAVR